MRFLAVITLSLVTLFANLIHDLTVWNPTGVFLKSLDDEVPSTENISSDWMHSTDFDYNGKRDDYWKEYLELLDVLLEAEELDDQAFIDENTAFNEDTIQALERIMSENQSDNPDNIKDDEETSDPSSQIDLLNKLVHEKRPSMEPNMQSKRQDAMMASLFKRFDDGNTDRRSPMPYLFKRTNGEISMVNRENVIPGLFRRGNGIPYLFKRDKANE